MLETALEVAMATAREASELLRAHLQALLTIQRKGVRDLITDADLAAQALIVERLQGSFPAHAIWVCGLAPRHAATAGGPRQI